MKVMASQRPEGWDQIGEIIKDYSSRTAEQNVNKFGVKHHWEKGNKKKMATS